ncbi:PAP2 family protein [Bacillus sp. SG-1]|nr:PAP2 family protein [Bacillus sp. SG-1]
MFSWEVEGVLLKHTNLNRLSKRVIALLAAGFIAIFSTTYLFISLAEDVLENEKFAVDQAVGEFVSSINTSTISSLMGYITEAGAVIWLAVGTFILTAYLFFTKRSNWFIIFLLINMFGISALTKGLKLLFERERPEVLSQYDGTGFSFPSGHTTGAVALYGYIIYLVGRSHLTNMSKSVWIAFLSIWILAIAASRIFIDVHFFTDILAGLAIGLLWLLVCIFSLETLLVKKGKKDGIDPKG